MEEKALEFASKSHGSQLRKYTSEPYIAHPIRVAEMVKTVTHSPTMICAAYLHDVVEDTAVSIEDIQRKFGREVAQLVAELTDVYTKEAYPQWNRRERKVREVKRQSGISREAKTIKLADVIDNTRDITKSNPGFAKKYIPEMFALTNALQGGNFSLLSMACYEIEHSRKALKIKF